ncbi:MAG TPA: YHS domain protein [Spirochaetes bacterium]|nr:YHS domain protein [Spirochaetota bacterium]
MSNLAIEGYDVLGYFKENKAIKGSPENTVEHNGLVYHFASAENKKTYQSDPDKYIPQYDGWCAFGMAKMKSKVAVDPNTFAIHNGKLLLFFNGDHEGKHVNTKVMWEEDKEAILKEANEEWTKMKSA